MTIQKHNDEFGYKRGVGAYSKEDGAFDPRSKHKYDSFTVVNKKHDYLLDNQRDQPAGKWLGGGGPVNRNAGGKGPPRYAPKTGPIGIMKKPK